MKKAQGISMNVIVIAAIALLVLVVLIAIFSGRMGLFNKDLNDKSSRDCKVMGGFCNQSASCTGDNYVVVFGADIKNCPGTVKSCCKYQPRT